MEYVYAFEVYIIEYIQKWFIDSEDYFIFINNLSNSHYGLEYMFPFISIFDSVFAAQLLLCIAFGGWATSIMKWWLLEDRPYWWVRETTFYIGQSRPQLRQNHQTCESGPGSPSGHTTNLAMELVLISMWISHVMNDRKIYLWWWKYVSYTAFTVALSSVMLARIFVAAHFPHQCVLGALLGTFLAPALCIYVTDPYIWRYGPHAVLSSETAMFYHIVSAGASIAITAITYYSLYLCDIDPHWSAKLARKHCDDPESIHESNSPMYSLAESTASLLGWAIAVSPAIAKYRHNSENRSLTLATFAAGLIYVITKKIESTIDKSNPYSLYSMVIILSMFMPVLHLRIVPYLASWPYSLSFSRKKLKTK